MKQLLVIDLRQPTQRIRTSVQSEVNVSIDKTRHDRCRSEVEDVYTLGRTVPPFANGQHDASVHQDHRAVKELLTIEDAVRNER